MAPEVDSTIRPKRRSTIKGLYTLYSAVVQPSVRMKPNGRFRWLLNRRGESKHQDGWKHDMSNFAVGDMKRRRVSTASTSMLYLPRKLILCPPHHEVRHPSWNTKSEASRSRTITFVHSSIIALISGYLTAQKRKKKTQTITIQKRQTKVPQIATTDLRSPNPTKQCSGDLSYPIS